MNPEATDPADRQWFDDLFTAHAGAIQRYFLRRAPHQEAQDLAADVLATAWRRRDDVPAEAVLPWLYRTAGFVLANGSMSSQQSGEGAIRQKLVEADLVDCMVALPGQLFQNTQIPACLWILTRNKGARGHRKRHGEVLFIDARKLGQWHLLREFARRVEKLARERGACSGFNETMYAKGVLPIDTYKKDLDAVCSEPLHLDWEALRADIVEHGLRNSTLSSLMPSETSSQISNATNGIEPPRGLVTVKQSKDGILKQVVPDYEKLKGAYELLWQMPNNDGYLQLVGIMQKFVDQAISANTNYDPQRFEGGRVPMKQLLKDLLTAYKFGLKTLYYQNTRDGADDDPG